MKVIVEPSADGMSIPVGKGVKIDYRRQNQSYYRAISLQLTTADWEMSVGCGSSPHWSRWIGHRHPHTVWEKLEMAKLASSPNVACHWTKLEAGLQCWWEPDRRGNHVLEDAATGKTVRVKPWHPSEWACWSPIIWELAKPGSCVSAADGVDHWLGNSPDYLYFGFGAVTGHTPLIGEWPLWFDPEERLVPASRMAKMIADELPAFREFID